MMDKKILIGMMAFIAIQSCSNADEKTAATHEKDTISLVGDSTAMHRENLFKDVVFDAKKDFICGMPITAGVADTSHYMGKVYGFCSKECKDEFLKNPAAYIAAK